MHIHIYIKRVDKKNPYLLILVLLLPQLLYIGALKFLCLPHITKGILCGVSNKILKILCVEADEILKSKSLFYQHPLPRYTIHTLA